MSRFEEAPVRPFIVFSVDREHFNVLPLKYNYLSEVMSFIVSGAS